MMIQTTDKVGQVRLSVCIPAYNRARYLSPLLDSIMSQQFQNFNIIIAEDNSPERHLIASIVAKYSDMFPNKIKYIENKENLGYDGNIRTLIEHADGDFCVFLGNDDLLCADALTRIADVAFRFSECGVIVRSYATFDTDPANQKQTFRYFPQEHSIQPGRDAIVTAFRRSVVIPGMTIHRQSALELATSEFDGSLLYQLYLVGRILQKRSVVFTPSILALRRDGVAPDFGNSSSEQGKFVPNEQTPASSLHFVQEMLRIAQYVEDVTGLPVYDGIRRDIGNYSFPILAIQAKRRKFTFLRYGVSLGLLGLWRSPLFSLYFLSLFLFGQEFCETVIKAIKKRLGFTPRLGLIRRGRG